MQPDNQVYGNRKYVRLEEGFSTVYKNAIFLLGKLYLILEVITTNHALVSAYDYDSRPPGVPPTIHRPQEKQGTTHKFLSAIIKLTCFFKYLIRCTFLVEWYFSIDMISRFYHTVH